MTYFQYSSFPGRGLPLDSAQEFYDTILPFNGFLICIFVIYRWKKSNFNAELDQGAPDYKNSLFERYVDFSVGTFIPFILLLVFINTVALKYFGVALIG